MAQHDYVIANGTGAAVRSDLNNALAAIVSQNSGATAPSPTYAFQFWADTTTGLLKLRNSSNNAWVTLFQLDGEWSTLPVENGTAAAPSIYFKDSGTDTGFYSPGTDQVAISTGGSPRLTIDSSGRLLLGTSSARSNDLFGTSQSQVEGTDSDTSSISIIRNTANTGAGGIALCKSRSSSIGGVTVVQSGDVLGFIDFQGADGTDFARAATIEAQVDGTPGNNDMPGRLVFSTTADGVSSPTERMRIENTGLTKVTSVANNSYAFQVYSNGTSGQQYGIYISTANDQNGTSPSFLECVGGATTRAKIYSNGGLANYSANNANLSDRNAKKDISLAADTWDCIKQWEIVNYRYKNQPDDADLNLGVIAQQVAESCPEVITIFQEAKEATEDQPAQEERLGVKEQQMYWMAIKALQEAQVRIEQLEAKVAALESA